MVEMNQTLQQRVDQLEAENAALKAKGHTKVGIKVSAKGAVSLYGLQRFPVTLYAEQWERVLGMADDLKEFMADHSAELAVKG